MELFEVDDGYDKERYTRKIPHIQYEPKGTMPSVFSLYNVDKYYQLRKEINDKKIPDDIKKFLSLRHDCKEKDCPCESPICETIDERAGQFLKE